MPVKDSVTPYLDDLIAIRRDFHAHPELGFEETRTAGIVADKLQAYGVDEVHTGIAKTGVVGVVRGTGGGGGSNRAIGLRADMDALPIAEVNDFAHKSTVGNKMHACGHDGHTTMLLGAARWLADNRDAFDGTVYLVFQPAEEGHGGGRVMVQEGLFDRFPVEGVYGMHNMPGMPLGQIAMRSGPIMAATDEFQIRVEGKGSHAAMPQYSRDPILIGAHIVTALQSIASRRTDPIEQIVVSTTIFKGGDAFNVIPEYVELKGTVRTFLPDVRDLAETEMKRLVESIALGFDASAQVAYIRNYPATVNTFEETVLAAQAAKRIVGDDHVDENAAPKMGGEDFAYMLNEKPGAYIFLGNGMPGEKGGHMVHTPQYDFNDDVMAYGISYWASLVETALPVRT
ncbi:MAG: M20 aminoacylase family protein [Pseudomonadota bacterium]